MPSFKTLALAASSLLLLLANCTPSTSTHSEPPAIDTNQTSLLLGSWQMNEIHWITADTTYSIPKAQPGVFLLTPKSYAIIWTPTEEPRVPFEILAKPTTEEIQAGFRSIVFNSGSYEMTDSTLTTTATVAKVPGFEGGKQFYRYQLEGNQLTLQMFDETYPDGNKPEWYGRYETKFILQKR